MDTMIDTTAVESMPLTVAAKKALERILERRHIKEQAARQESPAIAIGKAHKIATDKYTNSLPNSGDYYVDKIMKMVESARKAGYAVDDMGYGDNWAVTVKPVFEGDKWDRIESDETSKVAPMTTDDLDAQIAHLWLADQDVEIRPLFNGSLQKLSEGNKIEEAR